MTYELIGVEETGRESLLLSGLTEAQATVRAYRLARDLAARCKVYVTWYRESDDQHGYLNPNGAHEIIGKSY